MDGSEGFNIYSGTRARDYVSARRTSLTIFFPPFSYLDLRRHLDQPISWFITGRCVEVEVEDIGFFFCIR